MKTVSPSFTYSGDQELAALIAIGYPDIDPDAPKRKSVDDLLTYL